MARSGSGFRTAVRVAKAIDRAHTQAVRDAERRRKALEREERRLAREAERQRAAAAREEVAREKARFKAALQSEKESFEQRCSERANLRRQFIDRELEK